MDWSKRRKIIYAIGFAAAAILLAAYPVYRLISKPPTCFDEKQNGTETGVDCGGGCALMCVSDVKAPRTVWAKAFPLGGSYYDLGAYVENVNTNAGVKNLRYTIRVFDIGNQILTEKKGETELAPASATLLFETNVALSGNPDRVVIVFETEDLTKWTRASMPHSIILTKNQSLINTDAKPRFDAVLVNTDPINDVANLALGAVIYDALRNPVAVSKTYVSLIPKGEERNIFFTWPNRFTKNPRGAKCEGLIDVNTATSSISTTTGTIACPPENFITEIVVTPRAIFAD
ncbi:MAG: hypothetical protein HZB11_00865 [Candidatus Yonathbacteria bacterium]|nr:hypothetical protein [Candidatus Yonathbacteria bacterium]